MAKRPAKATKPNLFIVGAPKCGTTSWYKYLGEHRDIFFPEIKEPHYFASDIPRMRWTDRLDAYEGLFADAGDAAVVGEASVMYLYSDEAAQAIRAYNPDARILIFLRPQEDLLPSLHHQYLYRFTEDVEDFEKAWRLSGRRAAEDVPPECRHPKLLDYAAIGRFSGQVERYLALFPPEQIRIVYFDEWTADPRGTYVRILDFLGVEDDGRTEFPRVNEAKSHGNAFLGRMISHPPGWAQAAVRLLRKLTGRKALGLGDRAAQLISVKGYRTDVPPALREEIRAAFAEDNRRLQARLDALPHPIARSGRGL